MSHLAQLSLVYPGPKSPITLEPRPSSAESPLSPLSPLSPRSPLSPLSWWPAVAVAVTAAAA